MKKILVLTDNLNRGGVASVVLSISEQLIPRGYIFDYITYDSINKNTANKLEQQKGKAFQIKNLSNTTIPKYVRSIRKIIRENGPYTAIHAHTSSFIWLACLAAKLENIPVRIGHAHGSKNLYRTSLFSRLVFSACRPLNRIFCTHMISCAEPSGKFTFGKNFEFLPNFVDHDKLIYNPKPDKNQYLSELNLEQNRKILGFIGFLGQEKNVEFLIDLFAELPRKQYYLLLIGSGEDYHKIKAKINSLGLEDEIIMTGQRSDIKELLGIIDLILMPSFSEGMSIALLQAQILSVPCLVSPGIPETNDIGAGLFCRCKCYDKAEWLGNIDSTFKNKRDISPDIIIKSLKDKGYDKDSVADRLDRIYQGK